MVENMNVRLGNPVVTFFWASAMFLAGIAVGAYWHPSPVHWAAIAIAAGVFAIVHELVCCFVWCSLSSWWIGRRMAQLKSMR